MAFWQRQRVRHTPRRPLARFRLSEAALSGRGQRLYPAALLSSLWQDRPLFLVDKSNEAARARSRVSPRAGIQPALTYLSSAANRWSNSSGAEVTKSVISWSGTHNGQQCGLHDNDDNGVRAVQDAFVTTCPASSSSFDRQHPTCLPLTPFTPLTREHAGEHRTERPRRQGHGHGPQRRHVEAKLALDDSPARPLRRCAAAVLATAFWRRRTLTLRIVYVPLRN